MLVMVRLAVAAHPQAWAVNQADVVDDDDDDDDVDDVGSSSSGSGWGSQSG